MVIAGNDSASLRAASNLSAGTNNSMTCVVIDLGMTFYTSHHGYYHYSYQLINQQTI